MKKEEKHRKLWALLERDQNADIPSVEKAFAHHLEYIVGKYVHNVTERDIYQAMAYTLRDALIDRYNETQDLQRKKKAKRMYYLSLEFLIGRLLDSNLVNMGMREITRGALKDFDFDLSSISESEPDAGLGNGGLGRLAACFLDSLATLDYPGFGCGLRYEFGIFRQDIENGFQKEAPDTWLDHGNPWEITRNDVVYTIGFYGHSEAFTDEKNNLRFKWIPGEKINAVAHDILVPGFNTRTVNHLRLWSARSTSDFNFDYFNHGDYARAVEDKIKSESITKVLYPNENTLQGKELRLKQQFILVSATLQDALTVFEKEESDYANLPKRAFFQMNDTHPAVAVAELIRILVDEKMVPWNKAVEITGQCLGYTNHTIMPEALERWDLGMFGRLLPRHLEIIYKINHDFLESLRSKDLPDEILSNLSIIQEGQGKKVRMANLAIIGSKCTNGVAALHSELLKKDLFHEFYALFPKKFQNKTNGIAHRRWIVSANPLLSRLITGKIGNEWISDLMKLRALEPYADDENFQNEWHIVKRENKKRLAEYIKKELNISIDTNSMFDVQVKRIHEYKRQLLNILRVIGDYLKIKENPAIQYTPRTIIFAGKAAPGYYRAKLIIKLINAVSQVVNNDKQVDGRLKVVFLPNYRVSLAEQIFPASDLSEQISTAGTEASGTGNMKFMLNGAVTIGTLDGANIEILEEAGEENTYIFGKKVDEIEALKGNGYNSRGIYESDNIIRGVLDTLKNGFFNSQEQGLFREIFDSLTIHGDQYFLLEDYHSYCNAQSKVSKDFLNQKEWLKKSILNSARSGKFSSDRTIKQYAEEIWDLKPIKQRPPRISAV